MLTVEKSGSIPLKSQPSCEVEEDGLQQSEVVGIVPDGDVHWKVGGECLS